MHLGIDFCSFLVDFGAQVGVENGTKNDQKSIPRSIKKRDSFQEGSGWLQKAATLIDPPTRSHDSPALGSKTALGEGIRGGVEELIIRS